MNELIKQWVLATTAIHSYVVNTNPQLLNMACVTFFTEDHKTWVNVVVAGNDIICIAHPNSTLPKHIDVPSVEEAIKLIALELKLEIATIPQ